MTLIPPSSAPVSSLAENNACTWSRLGKIRTFPVTFFFNLPPESRRTATGFG